MLRLLTLTHACLLGNGGTQARRPGTRAPCGTGGIRDAVGGTHLSPPRFFLSRAWSPQVVTGPLEGCAAIVGAVVVAEGDTADDQ
eukprot:6255142-Prymnesium_polylepis.2